VLRVRDIEAATTTKYAYRCTSHTCYHTVRSAKWVNIVGGGETITAPLCQRSSAQFGFLASWLITKSLCQEYSRGHGIPASCPQAPAPAPAPLLSEPYLSQAHLKGIYSSRLGGQRPSNKPSPNPCTHTHLPYLRPCADVGPLRGTSQLFAGWLP
jgi:hypothetical protein